MNQFTLADLKNGNLFEIKAALKAGMLATFGGCVLALSVARPEVVRLLLDAGADANHKGAFGRTALIDAAAVGNIESVRMLLAAGADVNAADNAGYTALHVAAEDGRKALCALLLDAGADSKAKTVDGATPVDFAKWDGRISAEWFVFGHIADLPAAKAA